ncbi:hypothetical protein HPP92_012354 [Vanilla planifolia]|uniref:Uncharacterized protein n=1 Tax=Vanilla planifolia TaxID=51239 RepID=A0A835V396_VANPL|nr:hypothetical protein HPP92_012354 [Vanilla planifolia]
MAKHRNKKKNKGGTAMDISVEEALSTPREVDISDPLQSKTALGAIHRTFKKGRLAKKIKNLRKQKGHRKGRQQHREVGRESVQSKNQGT